MSVGIGNRRRRARRFPIASALVYREPGKACWQKGETINVSRSGVLFQPDEPLPGRVGQLDFVVALPLGGGPAAPRVRCVGRVVRRALGDRGGIAVSIDAWALEGRPLN